MWPQAEQVCDPYSERLFRHFLTRFVITNKNHQYGFRGAFLKFCKKSVSLKPFVLRSHHSWLQLCIHTLLCTEAGAAEQQCTFPFVLRLFHSLQPHSNLKRKTVYVHDPTSLLNTVQRTVTSGAVTSSHWIHIIISEIVWTAALKKKKTTANIRLKRASHEARRESSTRARHNESRHMLAAWMYRKSVS